MFAVDIVTIQLLLLSCIVSLAIIILFFNWRHRKKPEPRKRFRNDGPLFGDEEEVSERREAAAEEEEEEAEAMPSRREERQQTRKEPFISSQETEDKRDNEWQGAVAPEERNVISITLRARRREGFSGNNLEAIFHRFNLHFGAMDIYHRQIFTGNKTEIAFSVLNGKEPGTLRHEDMAEGTPAIIFFIQTQNYHDPLRSFEEMIDVAEQFALSLDGLLYDDLGSDLTEQTINYYRDKIKEQMLTTRIKQAQRGNATN